MNRLARTVVLLISAALVAGAAHAATWPPPYAGTQFRYWAFSNHNDIRDWMAYWVPGPFHVVLEGWDLVDGPDQFRPEVGYHMRDARRSVYTIQWRHELDDERFWLGTEQVLTRGVVGRAQVSPIVTHHGGTLWVYEGGADYYWADYDFASVTVIRDPREGGLWVVPMRLRLANARNDCARNDWVQLTLAPASQRTMGWAADAKVRWVRVGFERNNRYDFTALENTVWTIGLEAPVPSLWR
jgi:hypothetical protein